VLFVAFQHSGVLGLRHERIALLPSHGCETAAFLPADLIEDYFGELAFRRAAGGLGAHSLGDLRLGCTDLIPGLCLRVFLGLRNSRSLPWNWI